MRRHLLFALVLAVSQHDLLAQSVQPSIRFGSFQNFGPQDVPVLGILKDPKFYVLTKGCKITGFDVSGAAMGKDYIGPYHSKNNKLTDAQVAYIKSLDSGGQLWLHHIHVKCKDGEHILGTGQTEFSIYYFNIP